MITGIIALAMAVIPGIGILSALVGPVAIVLGIVALRRKGLPTGAAKVGVATGAIATALAVAWVIYVEKRGAAERAASGSEVTQRWLTDRWSPSRGNCDDQVVTNLKADGTYTAPSTTPGRLAIGLWSLERGTLEMGNVFEQHRFTVRYLAYGELSLQAQGGTAAPLTMYRC
jgi:hypothetical protein